MLKILKPLKEILKSSWENEENAELIFTHKMRDKIGGRVIASRE
jgi:hypothetical protein